MLIAAAFNHTSNIVIWAAREKTPFINEYFIFNRYNASLMQKSLSYRLGQSKNIGSLIWNPDRRINSDYDHHIMWLRFSIVSDCIEMPYKFIYDIAEFYLYMAALIIARCITNSQDF